MSNNEFQRSSFRRTQHRPYIPWNHSVSKSFRAAESVSDGQRPPRHSLRSARMRRRRLDGHLVCSDGLNLSTARPEVQCERGTRSCKPCAELGRIPEGRASVANQVVENDGNKEIMTGVKQRCGP